MADGRAGQVLGAAARRLDRAGADAASGAGSGRRAEAPEQRHASRARRTTGCRGRTSVRSPSSTAIMIAAQPPPGRPGRRGAGRAPAPSASTTANTSAASWPPCQAVQAPDRERRAAVGLVDDRALVDRVQRVVAQRRDRRASAPRTGKPAANSASAASRRAAAGSRRPWVASSGASASGANFVRPASAAKPPRARGRAARCSSRRAARRGRARRRARRWSCTRARTA